MDRQKLMQKTADEVYAEVQKMVGETFEGLQKSARVDNFLTGESRGGLEKASQTTVGKEAARR